MQEYVIDATKKRLGRVATEAAHALMGKHLPNYAPHEFANVVVRVTNAGLIDLSPRLDETYAKYSGYPGGLRFETVAQVQKNHGIKEVVARTVSGMLPKNTHRARLLKKLIVTE